MAETRNPLCGCNERKERYDTPPKERSCGAGDSVYIDVSRILDSCRDKDCFENVRVYLSDIGQEILDRASSVRAKEAEIADTCISVSPMTFNRGFYQIGLRIYVHMTFETCVGGKPQCIDGLAVVEKNVILYGSEGHVRVFRSKAHADPCCDPLSGEHTADDNLPTAVLEIADPVVLSAKVIETCRCAENLVRCSQGCTSGCICSGDIPAHVLACLGGTICEVPETEHVLIAALGFFSVLRMERPAQFLVSATEYCVPDKECVFAEDDDPCAAFKRMAFPVDRFCPGK